MPKKRGLILASALLLTANCRAAPAQVHLYRLDCGQATFKGRGTFSGQVALPCLLIRHRQGDRIWDLGLGRVQSTVGVTLTGPLEALSLIPKDIAPHPGGCTARSWERGQGRQKMKIIEADYDVLAKNGSVILSGDWRHPRTRDHVKRLPVFSTSRADSLACVARIDAAQAAGLCRIAA